MAFKILTIANMELPFWKLPSGDTVDNRVPYSMSLVQTTFTGAGALQQIGITASDIERIRAGYNPFDILRANGATQSNPLVSDNVTFYGGSIALRGYIGSSNANFYVRVSDTQVPICVVDDNNDISIVSMDKVDDEWKLYVNYYGGDHGIAVTFTNNQNLYRLLRDFDWGDAPEPERSTLDMFDLSNRFSPRAKNSGMGNYILAKEDVDALMSDLWDTTIIEGFNYKVFGNPLDSVLSLKWYYGIRDIINKTQLQVPLTIGNLNMGKQSGESSSIRVYACASEYATFDFGTLNIDGYREAKNIKRDDYLDYAPFVRYQLYLPYVGYIDLNTNEIIDGILGIKLNINLLTGQGLYVLYTYNNEHNITSDETFKQVILTVPCSVAVEIPVSVDSMNSLSATVAQTIGSAIATGLGAGAKGVSGAMGVGLEATSDAIGNLADTPDSKRNGGAYNPDTGNLGALQPFLLITLPIIATPNGFTDVFGKRAAIIDDLSNCHGFTQIVGVTPDDNLQPNKYQSEIIALLQSGVYL